MVAYGGDVKFFFRDVRIMSAASTAEGRSWRRGGSVSIDWTRRGWYSMGAVLRAASSADRALADCELMESFRDALARAHLAFARANVAECGGRHVQVTSRDGVLLSRWQLLSFCGGSVSLGIGTSNLYFFAVRPMADGRLVATSCRVHAQTFSADATSGNPSLPSSSSSSSFSYPTASSTRRWGGIYASTSEDGVTWRSPIEFLCRTCCQSANR